ncbi:hypothetical protein D9613_009722 [Agrocybe pediades]|uniref:Uncharacterized protein n=1 Tax=Agrocybe pediades TaxID=84607 RepID=A0A8H4QYC1_9AGAR|nr:hypothetical protein D9613_009722 [Agrocybe pediades]
MRHLRMREKSIHARRLNLSRAFYAKNERSVHKSGESTAKTERKAIHLPHSSSGARASFF